uniref:Secreted protein n=1 Tax=Heterorhabditis bacteriophora TaxID=37862 RepID=A0A1I7WM15_HETBA
MQIQSLSCSFISYSFSVSCLFSSATSTFFNRCLQSSATIVGFLPQSRLIINNHLIELTSYMN